MGAEFFLSESSVRLHGLLLDKGYSATLADTISVVLDRESDVISMIGYLQNNEGIDSCEVIRIAMSILGYAS